MKPWEDGKSLNLQVLRTWYAKQMCLINGGGCSDTLLGDEDAKKKTGIRYSVQRRRAYPSACYMATQKLTRTILWFFGRFTTSAPLVVPPSARPAARGGAQAPAASPSRAHLFQHLVAEESLIPAAPALWARAHPPLGPLGAVSLLRQREKAVAG